MRSGQSRAITWFIALMLILSPILVAGPVGRVAAQEGTPDQGSEAIQEEATETPEPAIEATEPPLETPTAAPDDPPVETATTTAEEETPDVEAPPTEVLATEAPVDVATGTPEVDPAIDGTATSTSTQTATKTPTKTSTATRTPTKTATKTRTPTKTPTKTATRTPVVRIDQIKVTVSCRSFAETIRVTNNGRGSILVKGFASFVDPVSDEPIAVDKTIQPGHTAIFQAGHGAKYGTILTKKYIFTNSAFERDGIRISTSAGKLSKACDPKPQPVGEKWMEVNLSTQYAIAWQGGTRVRETYVSTGKYNFETPTGTYYILYKYYSQTMSGCEGGECWNTPDVPWVNYFTDYGHALHGKYWNNIYGAPTSHGCVNLPLAYAEWFYYWAPYGMRVYIHY